MGKSLPLNAVTWRNQNDKKQGICCFSHLLVFKRALSFAAAPGNSQNYSVDEKEVCAWTLIVLVKVQSFSGEVV
jgi:hypothetical protein